MKKDFEKEEKMHNNDIKIGDQIHLAFTVDRIVNDNCIELVSDTGYPNVLLLQKNDPMIVSHISKSKEVTVGDIVKYKNMTNNTGTVVKIENDRAHIKWEKGNATSVIPIHLLT